MVSYAYAGLVVSIVAFIVALFLLFRDSLANPLEFKFASRRGKIMVTVVIIAFLTMVSSTTYITLEKIRKNVEDSLVESLSTVLDTAYSSIKIWADDKKISLERAALDPRLVDYTHALITAQQKNKSLASVPAQLQVREHFTSLAGSDRNSGFFIISINGINLASMRDSNIGDVNPILLHKPELFARVLNGESILVHAIPSDVGISGSKVIKGLEVPPTLFFAAPVYSETDKLIAVLAERYDPAGDFSAMLSLGRLGESGETYAFNSDAELITASRFTDDFISTGLLAENEQSILSIRLSVPEENGEGQTAAETFTRMANSALRKENGIDVTGYPDYRGVKVVGAWLWDERFEMGVTTEQDYAEAFASYESAKLLILILLISTSVISIGYTCVILLLGNRATSYLEQLAKDLEDNVAERTNALSKSERLLQLVIDTVPAPIYMKDSEGCYELINSEFERVVNVKRKDTIGKTDVDIMPKSIGEALTERDKNIMRQGEAVILEEQAPLEDGSTQYFQSYKNPIRDSQGNVIGLTGVAFDITDREATAKALTDTLQSLSFVQYVVDDAAYMVVWADTETGLIEFGNRAAEAFLNLSASEILKLHAYEIDQQICREDFAKYIAENRKQAKTYETLVCAQGGSCRPVELTTQVINFGEKERLVIFARDISESKTLQTELIEAKVKAEEGSLAKSEFLASMSHEIRTPLNGVLGMIGLVRKTELSTDQDEKLRIAQSSATSLLGIINDLLDFSKIEAHKMDVEELDFNIAELMNDVVQSMSFKAEEKQIQLMLDTHGIADTNIKSDPTRIRQILVNLIGNAIKFTHQGNVRIEASLEKSGKNKLRLKCHVKDTGVGIAQDKLKGLFEKFTQADNTVTREYGGTGLGLAISLRLCELLNGSIQVASELGRGSDFSFDIEVTESHDIVKQLPNVDVSDQNILVVDDIEINRVIFRSQVESWGANVHEANNAKQALAMLNSQAEGFYNFILLDMNMPEMNGLELASFIRANPKHQTTQLIMITSTTENATISTLLEHGINGYFSKPIKPAELQDAIKVLHVHGEELAEAGIVVGSRYLESLSRTASVEQVNTEPEINPNLKILLVEDNEINQLIAKGMLENFQLTCHAVSDGQQVLDYLQTLNSSDDIDLILMDCQMPVLDGYATTEKIRQGEAGDWASHIPIVAMTAHALAGDKEKCLACGMNDFITKPIDEQEFQRVLKRYSARVTIKNTIDSVTETEQKNRVTSEPSELASEVTQLIQDVRWPLTLHTLTVDKPPAFSKFTSAYLAALLVLSEQSEQTILQFKTALQTGDFDELKNQAHALKGSSANLGFIRLSECCAEVETTIRDLGECGEQQVAQLIEQFNLCVEDANAIVALNQPQTNVAHSMHELKREIIELLESGQVVGSELIRELAMAVHKDEHREPIEYAVTCLNNFDYDEALKVLKAI